MKTVISLASEVAFAFSLDAQITATLNHLPNRLPEISIRNQFSHRFDGICDPYEPCGSERRE